MNPQICTDTFLKQNPTLDDVHTNVNDVTTYIRGLQLVDYSCKVTP